jgi:thioredoxin reductase
MDQVDAAIVGGSFAGLSAALYLARARKRTILFDDGVTRNRFARAGHGFLGLDGRAPFEMRMAGRRDVSAYPSVTLVDERVTGIVADLGRFHLATAQRQVVANRVILAFGMRDILPDLPGLDACWGISAMQCPYCHGYELADRPTAILMTGDASLHQARLIPDWSGDVTVFTNGHDVVDQDRRDLSARGLRMIDGRVAEVRQDGGSLSSLVMEDGRAVPCEVLYLVTRTDFAAALPQALGCAVDAGPFGPVLRVDAMQRTSVPGVFAAGDITRPAFSSTWAAADGVRAGVACHQSFQVDQSPWPSFG